MDHRQLALAAAADDGHHAVADVEALGPGAAVDHLAGQFQPWDVLGGARRRRVVPGQLMHVGAVEPGGMHPDEHLPVSRDGVGVLLHAELLVLDGDGAHPGPPYPRRTSSATHSMCGVCGNMSTGRTRTSS